MTHPRAFILTVRKTLPKCEATLKRLQSVGVSAEIFFGLDAAAMNLSPNNYYERNGVSLGIDLKTGGPLAGEKIGHRPVAACLSHLMMWKVLSYMPEDSFWCLEDDVEFSVNWKEAYALAMAHLPADWDIVFIGSCCAHGRPTTDLGGGLYEVKYPLCGHALQIRKKALPILIEAHQRIWAPLDIAMFHDSLPLLKVYTVLPRMCGQKNTFIPV
jgi:hypothetical protein